MEQEKKDDLCSIPGVGKNIAQDLRELGIFCTGDLKRKGSGGALPAGLCEKGIFRRPLPALCLSLCCIFCRA